MVFGAALFVFNPILANVLFFVGTLSFVSMQVRATYNGSNFVIDRLRRQQLLGACALCLSAIALTSQNFGYWMLRHNEWVVCLLIGSIIQLYTGFRIPQELEKENKVA